MTRFKSNSTRLAIVLPSYLLGIGISFWTANSTIAFDKILLRDLTLIRNEQVESFSEQGIRLKSGRILTWDQIERAKLETGDQARFDQLKTRLGDSLFRIRQRLANNDHDEALELAEQLSSNFESKRGPTSLMLSTAIFRGNVATGNRVKAILPFIRSIALQFNDDKAAAKKAGWISEIQQSLQPVTIQADSNISSDLLPVWFDAESAKTTYPKALELYESQKEKLPPAILFAIGSLAVCANQMEEAEKFVKELDAQPALNKLSIILKSQIAISKKETSLAVNQLEPLTRDASREIRLLALYWHGFAMATKSPEDRQQAALTLLKIVASYEDQFPHLAAAALDKTREIMVIDGDKLAAAALKNELLTRYKATWHGKKLIEKE